MICSKDNTIIAFILSTFLSCFVFTLLIIRSFFFPFFSFDSFVVPRKEGLRFRQLPYLESYRFHLDLCVWQLSLRVNKIDNRYSFIDGVYVPLFNSRSESETIQSWQRKNRRGRKFARPRKQFVI